MTHASPPPPRPAVLVAEDEANVRLMIAAVLRQRGFDALLCADGQEALERIASAERVDAALVDVRMPRVSGVELVQRLRAEPQWGGLPIVAMSAYNDERQEREIRAAGADRFLAKPFTIADLIAALREVMAAGDAPAPLPSN